MTAKDYTTKTIYMRPCFFFIASALFISSCNHLNHKIAPDNKFDLDSVNAK